MTPASHSTGSAASTVPGLALSMESSFLGFYAHAGFCAALAERGIRPSHVSGSSSGALVAALLAAGFDSAGIRDVLFDRAFLRSFWEASSFLRGLGMSFWVRGAHGLSSAARTRKWLDKVFANKAPRLEDCTAARPYIAVANLSTLTTEILTSGPTAASILASCAFPVLVAAQPLETGLCWDGGVADSCPFVHFAEMPEIHTVVTHHIVHGPEVADPWRAPGYRPRISEIFGRGHQLITNELQMLKTRRMEDAGKRLLPATTRISRPNLFSRRASLERCYAAGQETGALFQMPVMP